MDPYLNTVSRANRRVVASREGEGEGEERQVLRSSSSGTCPFVTDKISIRSAEKRHKASSNVAHGSEPRRILREICETATGRLKVKRTITQGLLCLSKYEEKPKRTKRWERKEGRKKEQGKWERKDRIGERGKDEGGDHFVYSTSSAS